MPETQTAKESVAPTAVPEAAKRIPRNIQLLQEDARALSRKLGRPLRKQIPDPLSEAEFEELILARILDYDNRRPAEELLEEFAYLRRKPRKQPQ